MKLALTLAGVGLALNVWMLWRPLPRELHAKPRCTLKAPVKRFSGGDHGAPLH